MKGLSNTNGQPLLVKENLDWATGAIQAAMRDVEDLHHAVDEREPNRDDEQPGRVGDPVDDDGEQVAHAAASEPGHERNATSSRRQAAIA